MEKINLSIWSIILILLISFLNYEAQAQTSTFEGLSTKIQKKQNSILKKDLKIFMRNDIELRLGDPEIYAPLMQAVKNFEDEYNVSTSVTMLPDSQYLYRLADLNSKKNSINMVHPV